MTTRKKILFYLGLLIVVSIILFGYYNASRFEKTLDEHGLINNGTIIEYESIYKSRQGFNYSLILNGKTYDGYYSSEKNYKALIGKSFPVIYNPTNPEENRMMIFPRDFKRFNLQFPDSLNWVLDYK